VQSFCLEAFCVPKVCCLCCHSSSILYDVSTRQHLASCRSRTTFRFTRVRHGDTWMTGVSFKGILHGRIFKIWYSSYFFGWMNYSHLHNVHTLPTVRLCSVGMHHQRSLARIKDFGTWAQTIQHERLAMRCRLSREGNACIALDARWMFGSSAKIDSTNRDTNLGRAEFVTDDAPTPTSIVRPTVSVM
jgi:hypothetical protein